MVNERSDTLIRKVVNLCLRQLANYLIFIIAFNKEFQNIPHTYFLRLAAFFSFLKERQESMRVLSEKSQQYLRDITEKRINRPAYKCFIQRSIKFFIDRLR